MAPGSSGILVSMLTTRQLLFPASSALTKDCSFFRIKGVRVTFDGAMASDLLFVRLPEMNAPFISNGEENTTAIIGGGINVINGASVTNCRFIQTMVHSPGATVSVKLLPREGGTFASNTFLWQNSLGAMQATYDVTGAQELTIVGSDVESYGAAFWKAVLQTRQCGNVRVYGLHGRVMSHGSQWLVPDTGLVDSEAEYLQLLQPVIARVLGDNMTANLPEVIIRPGMKAFLQWAGTNYTMSDLDNNATSYVRFSCY